MTHRKLTPGERIAVIPLVIFAGLPLMLVLMLLMIPLLVGGSIWIAMRGEIGKQEEAPEVEEFEEPGFKCIGGERDGKHIVGSPNFMAMARDGMKLGEYTLRTQPNGKLCFVVEAADEQ